MGKVANRNVKGLARLVVRGLLCLAMGVHAASLYPTEYSVGHTNAS
jgi:hypothetical protein